MEEEEAEADLEAIQAHLEMSMALTYQAVEASLKNSTLPDEQTYESLATFKPRPPRWGVYSIVSALFGRTDTEFVR